MKSKNIIFLLLFLPFIVQAQNVKIKKDQVSINKKPYCITDCGGAFVGDCKVKTLDGKILATLILNNIQVGEDAVSVYEITFLNTNYKAQQGIGLGYAKKLMKEFYEFEIIKDGNANLKGIKNFAQTYSKDLIADYKEQARIAENTKVDNKDRVDNGNIDKNDDKYKLIERDRTKSISLYGEDLKQDFEKIGYYSYRKFHDDTVLKEEYKFYLPTGQLIAKAVMKHFDDDNSCQITTIKDNEIITISVEGTFERDKVKIIAKYLIDRYYL